MRARAMGLRYRSSNSSGEEDGDADWKAAINSVSTDFNGSVTNEFTYNSSNSTKRNGGASNTTTKEDGKKKQNPQTLKLYQIKAQKALEDLLDKSLVVVKDDPVPASDTEPVVKEDGIRLFRQAPPGIACDPIDEFQHLRKRPRIVPGELVDEKSKKFRHQLQSVVVDGIDVMAAARDSCKKSLARFEAKDAVAKATAKREEERVAELKRIRGEKWLPSIAKEMQGSK